MKRILGVRIDPWETRKEMVMKAGIVAAILVFGIVLAYLISLLWEDEGVSVDEQVPVVLPEPREVISKADISEPSSFEEEANGSPGFPLSAEKIHINNTKTSFRATNESALDLGNRQEDLIILNPDVYSKDDVVLLKLNKNVFAQVSVGLADETKEYWNQKAVYLVDQYGGGLYYVDFSRTQWHEIAINEVVKAKKKGFEGVVLDNVDQGYKRSFEAGFVRLRRSNMENLIQKIGTFVRDGRFLVFVDGGEEMYPAIQSAIDGVIVDTPLHDAEIDEEFVVIGRD